MRQQVEQGRPVRGRKSYHNALRRLSAQAERDFAAEQAAVRARRCVENACRGAVPALVADAAARPVRHYGARVEHVEAALTSNARESYLLNWQEPVNGTAVVNVCIIDRKRTAPVNSAVRAVFTK